MQPPEMKNCLKKTYVSLYCSRKRPVICKIKSEDSNSLLHGFYYAILLPVYISGFLTECYKIFSAGLRTLRYASLYNLQTLLKYINSTDFICGKLSMKYSNHR